MNKYGAKITEMDGIKFASIKEAEFYQELKLRKFAKDIKDFELQPKFELVPAFEHQGRRSRAITYTADFKIFHNNGAIEIVDVKSKATKTEAYSIRKRLFLNKYPDLIFTEA